MDEVIKAIRACAKGEKSQIDISKILNGHRCYYLTKGSEDFMGMMRRTVNHVAVKERYSSCKQFFEKITFPYAVIKGAVLSSAVYGDPSLRISGDIDILLRRKDVDEAKRLLKECGFVQGRVTEKGIVPFARKEILYQATMTHQTSPFIKSTGNALCPYVNLDVNMDIMWGESEQHADMDEVLAHRQQYSLFDVDFYKLIPEMEFIALCLHHYKDMNSIYMLAKGSLRLGLFCDIYFYLRHLRPSAERILELGRKFNVGKYIYVCLVHTMEIFDDSILESYIDVLRSDREEILLDTFGLNEKERKSWGIPLFQRLFHPDLPQYMQGLLTESDREKIRINQENM